MGRCLPFATAPVPEEAAEVLLHFVEPPNRGPVVALAKAWATQWRGHRETARLWRQVAVIRERAALTNEDALAHDLRTLSTLAHAVRLAEEIARTRAASLEEAARGSASTRP